MGADEASAELPLDGAGGRLRRAREAQGLSRADIAQRTRIPERHLAAIEQGDFAALPARTYASAVEFLDVAGSLTSGCIVTDVRMPQMSGLDLVRRLKERGVLLPVIVITGHGDVPLAVEAMRAGVIDFLEKRLMST